MLRSFFTPLATGYVIIQLLYEVRNGCIRWFHSSYFVNFVVRTAENSLQFRLRRLQHTVIRRFVNVSDHFAVGCIECIAHCK